MTITVVVDPDRRLTPQLDALRTPVRRDFVVVRPLPGSESGGFFRDVLIALGQDADHLEPNRVSARRCMEWATAWTTASQTNVVVVGASALSEQGWRWLGDVHAHRGVLVVFETRDELRHIPSEASCELPTFESVAAELARAIANRPKLPPMAARVSQFPAVPADEFPHFLTMCRAALSEADFMLVRKAFKQGLHAAHAYAAAHERRRMDAETVGEMLRRLTRRAVTRHEALTLIRGAQVGFFRRGYLLRVSTVALAAAEGDRRRGGLDATELALLDTVPDPRVVVAAGLSLLGATTHDLMCLRDLPAQSRLALDDVLTDVRPLSTALRALAVMRREHSTTRGGLLLLDHKGQPMSAAQIHRLLRTAARELGLRFEPSQLGDQRAASRLWRNRRHIRLDRLETWTPNASSMARKSRRSALPTGYRSVP